MNSNKQRPISPRVVFQLEKEIERLKKQLVFQAKIISKAVKELKRG